MCFHFEDNLKIQGNGPATWFSSVWLPNMWFSWLFQKYPLVITEQHQHLRTSGLSILFSSQSHVLPAQIHSHCYARIPKFSCLSNCPLSQATDILRMSITPSCKMIISSGIVGSLYPIVEEKRSSQDPEYPTALYHLLYAVLPYCTWPGPGVGLDYIGWKRLEQKGFIYVI